MPISFALGKHCDRRALAIIGVVAVLLVFVAVRVRHASRQPVQISLGEYPHSYSRSLSLMAGRGYQRLPLPEGVGGPIRRFLDCEVDQVSASDWQAYLDVRPEHGELGCYRYIDPARIGELYTAAFVWSLFGIRWSALIYFHIAVGAAATAALMLLTYKISGRTIAALTTGLVCAFAQLEVSLPMRDNNAFWLATFGFLAFGHLSGRFAPSRVCLATFALGAAANLGYLWRPTSLAVAAFIFAASSLRWCFDGRGFRQALVSVACFLVGAGGVIGVARLTQTSADGIAMSTFFHVAHFGEHARGNLLGVENTFQVAHDDSKTAADAFAFRSTETSGDGDLTYCSPRYGEICREMYFAALPHRLYDWIRGIPHILSDSLESPGRLRRVVPLLFLLGTFAVWGTNYARFPAAAIALFLPYYAAIWFALSPEPRHRSMFLIPLSVIGGLGAAVVGDLYRELRRREFRSLVRPVARHAAWSVAIIVLWAGGCLIAAAISADARAALLADVAAQTENGERLPVGEDVREYAIHHPPGDANIRTGYLFEIEAGAAPAELLCKQLRASSAPPETFGWIDGGPGSDPMTWLLRTIWWNVFLQTRHPLRPGIKQQFFVTCCRDDRSGDRRGVSLKTQIKGDARIVAVRRLDLADWKHLQTGTVFVPGEPSGTPRLSGAASRTLQHVAVTPEGLAELGLDESADGEQIKTANSPPENDRL